MSEGGTLVDSRSGRTVDLQGTRVRWALRATPGHLAVTWKSEVSSSSIFWVSQHMGSHCAFADNIYERFSRSAD